MTSMRNPPRGRRARTDGSSPEMPSTPLILGLRRNRNERLDADRIEDLLQSDDTDRLILGLFVTADHLFAHTQPPRQFGLRDSLSNPNLCDERGKLIEPLDLRQIQFAGLQLIVLAQFVFELPDHVMVAPADCGGALASRLQFRLRERLPEAFDLSQCPVSLRVALDHDRAAFIT
jgi:hypothetical protein